MDYTIKRIFYNKEQKTTMVNVVIDVHDLLKKMGGTNIKISYEFNYDISRLGFEELYNFFVSKANNTITDFYLHIKENKFIPSVESNMTLTHNLGVLNVYISDYDDDSKLFNSSLSMDIAMPLENQTLAMIYSTACEKFKEAVAFLAKQV